MALRLRDSKDVKKSFYYVWYLGAREAKGVDAMPGAIAYLLERERLQEPFKVTLQVSNKGLKIIQTVHPSGSTRSAVKHLVPGHAVLAAVQREDIVAATLLLPNPATNNPVHVHAYRCDSVETAELLGGQLKALASHTDNLARVTASEGRIRSNLGSDGRSTRESESSEGSGELRHDPVQTTIYESLAAELRAKLGRGNSDDNDVGPILLPPRDYDTVHRHRGNLAGIEFRRCLNQTIVGGSTAIDRGGTRSAASSGIGSDSAATPPPYQTHHPLGQRPSRPCRDSSSDDDWGALNEENDYLPEVETAASSLTLPRLPRSPERLSNQANRGVSPNCNRNRRAAEFRQRSPSPQYQPRINPGEVTSPRERFQDAKEMFRAMEREAIARPVFSKQRDNEHHPVHSAENIKQHQSCGSISSKSRNVTSLSRVSVQRSKRDVDAFRFVHIRFYSAFHARTGFRVESARQVHEDRSGRQHPTSMHSMSSHDHVTRRNQQDALDRENGVSYKGRPRPRTHHYAIERSSEPEISRPRPRSFYENPGIGRDFRDQRNPVDQREVREFRERMQHSRELRDKLRTRSTTYQELSEHERYPGLDRESARPTLEMIPTPGRYRHSYAEPPRLGLAALHPY